MTIDHEDIELPQHLLDLAAEQPANIGRKGGAELVSKHLFPTSPATVKAWPLPWEYPNGCAVAPPVAYLIYAWRKARKAPGIGFGRRASPQTAGANT